MPRTALLYVVPAALVATAWLSLEQGRAQDGSALFLVLLALVPGLARTWRLRAAAALLAAPVALAHAFGRSVSRDFVGPLVGDLLDGFLTFYDVTVPFEAGDQPLMHGAVLTAIFAFCLAISLTIAARRPLLASLALVSGAAWPATLVGDSNELRRGALLLAAVLALLAFGGRVQARTYRPALVAGGAVVAAALAAGTLPAVAKGEFLSWKGWDFYDRPADPVGVDYVWDASYRGIAFPKEPTTVLTVTGPRRTYYWRAGTLDSFVSDHWIEDAPMIDSAVGFRELSDPLLPRRAREESAWVRARVKVEALRDDHLVAPGTPVAYDTGAIGLVEHHVGGTVVVPGGLERDDAYTVWGYSARPTPEELARVPAPRALRGTAESRYLEVAPGAPTLPFGDPDREERLETYFAFPEIEAYRPLYEAAREVVGNPRRPYAAVAALEAWFRRGGGFTYDEQPPQTPNFPALVTFATNHKRGYCQHFAGAMALMLRYLGVPARVAVGFLPGSFDSTRQRWTVRDHDAHAWVEVWFQGWGWLPFDPTPSRGILAAPYSTASATPGAITAIQALLRREGVGGLGSPSPFGPAEGTQVGGRDVPGEAAGASGEGADRAGSLLRLLLVVAAALMVLIGAAKLARRLVRLLPRDPRRVAAACRRELADYLLDQGIPVSRSATARELGRAAESRLWVDSEAFVRAVGAARFGPPEAARAAARDARRELRALRRDLRRTVSARRRAQGFLSVRSLGLGSSS